MDAVSNAMRYLIVLVPILVSVLLAAANRFNSGVKWILLRSSAENIKREIYRYRTRAEIYSPEQTQNVSREAKLSEKLQALGRRLMQSEVDMTALQNLSAPPDADRLSRLTPRQYLSDRLEDQLDYFVTKTVKLEKRLNYLQWSFYAIGGLGTLLAAVGLEVWIALTTSIVTALTTYMEYLQLEKDLAKKNQAAIDLANVRAWWVALSAQEQTKQYNIDVLVGNAERILQSEFTNWMQEMHDALEKLKEQQEEQVEKSQRKKTGQPPETLHAQVPPLPADDTDQGKAGIVAVEEGVDAEEGKDSSKVRKKQMKENEHESR